MLRPVVTTQYLNELKQSHPAFLHAHECGVGGVGRGGTRAGDAEKRKRGTRKGVPELLQGVDIGLAGAPDSSLLTLVSHSYGRFQKPRPVSRAPPCS